MRKRQLLTPFRLSYDQNYELFRGGNAQEFCVNCQSEVKIEKVKMKVSLQDMHLLYQIITFANENVSQEYFKKLELIEQYSKQGA